MISDDELATKLIKLSSSAVKYHESEYSAQQEKALDYYLGKPMPGDDEEDMERRSKVVSRDVAEIIDWSLPELVRMFVGSENAVEFQATKAEAEEQADQVTEVVKHVFFNENDGFNIVHDQIKDGLLQKLGVVRVWYGKRGEAAKQIIEGAEAAALAAYDADPDVNVISVEEREDGKIDLRLEEIEPAQVHIDNIAPEHFLISEQATQEDTAPYIATRSQRTKSELLSEGYKKADLEGLSDGDGSPDDEEYDRDEGAIIDDREQGVDDASRNYWVYEEFSRIDVDEDGESEWIRTVRVGKRILHKEEVSEQDFVCFTPKRMPHRVLGASLADDVMDIQEVKTALYRGSLDNVALVIDPQTYVDMSAATEDTINDIQDHGPGGIVRGKGPKAAEHYTYPDISGSALNMIEYVDTAREQRTGVSRYNQGMDSDSLNKTATGVNRIMEAGQQRRDLIARLYAEALRKIFQKVFKLLVRHQDQERMMRIRGEWEPINPRLWHIGMKARPLVGLGTGNKDAQRDNSMLLLQTQAQVAPYGITDQEKMYNAADKFVSSLNIGDTDSYFVNPANLPPQPEQPDPEQLKNEADIQMKQAELQIKEFEVQQKVQSAETLAAQKMEHEKYKAELAQQMEREKEANRMEIEREKIKVQSQLKIMEMQIQESLKEREIEQKGKTNENIKSPVDS